MDKRIKIIVAGALLPLSIIAPVFTVDAVLTDGHVQAQSMNLELKTRISQYKKFVDTTMSKSQLERFQLRCGIAQTVVRDLIPRIETVQKQRSTVYNTILTHLEDLIEKLKAQKIDTKEFNTRVALLKEKIKDYDNQMTNYKQAVSDIAAMKCENDPQGFKAALEIARRSHAKLMILVVDIRIYITNTIKPSLMLIREDLAKQAKKQTQKNEGSTHNATRQ